MQNSNGQNADVADCAVSRISGVSAAMGSYISVEEMLKKTQGKKAAKKFSKSIKGDSPIGYIKIREWRHLCPGAADGLSKSKSAKLLKYPNKGKNRIVVYLGQRSEPISIHFKKWKHAVRFIESWIKNDCPDPAQFEKKWEAK